MHDKRVLGPVRRLIVKIGSAVLAPEGELDPSAVARLADDLAAVRAAGVVLTIVSSGAVASGFRLLGFEAPPKAIAHKQAAAAVGQPRLMDAWARAFARHGLTVAQVLYTADDLRTRARYLNTRHTLNELLERGMVPVVNENDTVSFAEIKLGDNDSLSALTAGLADADLLLILSTAGGLYRGGKAGEVIGRVGAGEDAHHHVRVEKSAVGTGGFATKLKAASAAARWGIPTIVAGGSLERVVSRVLAGEPLGTLFEAGCAKVIARKRWLGWASASSGVVVIDAGAARAITQRGASLLPSGIVRVEGRFERDDTIEIRTEGGELLARGLAAYSAAETNAIRGKKASQIVPVLGYCYQDEVVHRSDLVLLTDDIAPSRRTRQRGET